VYVPLGGLRCSGLFFLVRASPVLTISYKQSPHTSTVSNATSFSLQDGVGVLCYQSYGVDSRSILISFTKSATCRSDPCT
jgi:hypothetical protein